MRLFLDQMLRGELANRLREAGHDVLRPSEVGESQADDAEILERAIAEDRLLITLDSHFGDWVVLPLREHPGVVRVRAHPATSSNVAAILVPLLDTHAQDEFRNKLVIASSNRVRWIRTT